MLEDYAEKNGFTGICHFTDDRISGTTFERDGLQAMLAEVEKGNIGTIIVKDMSCLGRKSLQVDKFHHSAYLTSKMYVLFAQIQAAYKESQSLKGLVKMKYDKEHKDTYRSTSN